jgi:hypothetical protein
MKKFTLALFATALVCEGLIYLIFNTFLQQKAHPATYFFPVFFFALYFFVHRFLVSVAKGDAKRSVNMFMAATAAKMLLSMMIVIILVFSIKDAYRPVILTFVAVYLFFMGIELPFILKEMKKPSGTGNDFKQDV